MVQATICTALNKRPSCHTKCPRCCLSSNGTLGTTPTNSLPDVRMPVATTMTGSVPFVRTRRIMTGTIPYGCAPSRLDFSFSQPYRFSAILVELTPFVLCRHRFPNIIQVEFFGISLLVLAFLVHVLLDPVSRTNELHVFANLPRLLVESFVFLSHILSRLPIFVLLFDHCN